MADKEPSATGEFVADPGDAAGYRRQGRPRTAARNSRSIGNTLILAVLVVGLAVAGWFVATQHQALVKAEAELSHAGQRIAVLEERLQVTDATMSESGREVNAEIGRWEDEIRKLWDVSNKRNRTWIEENRDKIKAHAATLASIDTSLKEMKTSLAKHEQTLGQHAALVDQLAALELSVRQQVNQQRQLTDQVNAMRQTVAGLESSLVRRVTDNEKAVQAIDAYRLQLNSRLVDLQTRVDNLSTAPTP